MPNRQPLLRFDLSKNLTEISACIERGWFLFPAYRGDGQQKARFNDHFDETTNEIDRIVEISRQRPVDHWRVRLGSLSKTFVLVVAGELGQYAISRLCEDGGWTKTLQIKIDDVQYYYLKRPYASAFRKEARKPRLGIQILDEDDSLPIPLADVSGVKPYYVNPEAAIEMAPAWLLTYAFL